jgi:hypothetical protein
MGAMAGSSLASGIMKGATPLVAAISILGFLLGAGACFVWYRWLFRGALSKAIEQLGGLLKSVETQLSKQMLFSGEPESRVAETSTRSLLPR